MKHEQALTSQPRLSASLAHQPPGFDDVLKRMLSTPAHPRKAPMKPPPAQKSAK